MSMTIQTDSRSLKQCLLVDDFDHEASRQKTTTSIRHSQSSFFVKTFFSEPRGGFIVAFIHKPGYYFNNNNCYNRSPVHIIRTVI